MDYDVEREKQKSEEIRKVFREMFPLANENDLPWAACQIAHFLGERIKREVEEGTRHWTSRVVRVLCEVSPPKTHVEDMARICVEQAKEVPRLKERLTAAEARLAWLRDKLMTSDIALSQQLGLPKGWTSLDAAIDSAMRSSR